MKEEMKEAFGAKLKNILEIRKKQRGLVKGKGDVEGGGRGKEGRKGEDGSREGVGDEKR